MPTAHFLHEAESMFTHHVMDNDEVPVDMKWPPIALFQACHREWQRHTRPIQYSDGVVSNGFKGKWADQCSAVSLSDGLMRIGSASMPCEAS